MSTTLWIVLGVVVILVVGYVVGIRMLVGKSREQEKQIDYSKVRKWEDED